MQRRATLAGRARLLARTACVTTLHRGLGDRQTEFGRIVSPGRQSLQHVERASARLGLAQANPALPAPSDAPQRFHRHAQAQPWALLSHVVLVGNGVEPDYVPDGVQSVTLDENTGIPEGRNVVAHALAAGSAEFVLFFDNDAVLPDPHTLTRLIAEFDRHPNAAYVQPRIADPATGETLGRWVPRLRSGDARRSGIVTVMAEGVVLVRRADFDAAGRWPGHFFLFHEGVDMSWRLWDLGKIGWYAGDIKVHHPATNPARHGPFYRMVARNRVWVARRRLPAPLVPVYLATWVVISVWRFRSSGNLGVWFKGFAEGLRGGHGERRPMRWRTVRRLTRTGRPPIV